MPMRLAALFTLVAMLTPSVVAAQEPSQAARDAFDRATELYQQGAFLQAADAFIRSYELMDGSSRQYLIAFNVGQSFFDAQQWTQAREWLRRYIASAGSEDDLRPRAETMLREIETRESLSHSGETTEQRDARRAPSSATTGDDDGAISPIGPIVAGVGAAALVAAAITGAVAASAYSSIRKQCADGVCPESRRTDVDRVGTLALTTDILWVSGAVLAALGLVLTFVLPTGNSSGGTDDPTVAVGFGPGSLFARGTFSCCGSDISQRACPSPSQPDAPRCPT